MKSQSDRTRNGSLARRALPVAGDGSLFGFRLGRRVAVEQGINLLPEVPSRGNQRGPHRLDGQQPGSRIGVGVGGALKEQESAESDESEGKDPQQQFHGW